MLKNFIYNSIIKFCSSCDYKPVYSNQNKINYKIIITDFSGDKDINNLVAANLKEIAKINLIKQ